MSTLEPLTESSNYLVWASSVELREETQLSMTYMEHFLLEENTYGNLKAH